MIRPILRVIAVAVLMTSTTTRADVLIGGPTGDFGFGSLNGDVISDTSETFTDTKGTGTSVDDVDSFLTTTGLNVVNFSGSGTTLVSYASDQRLGMGRSEWGTTGTNPVSMLRDSWTFTWSKDAILRSFTFSGVDTDNNGERFILSSGEWSTANGGSDIPFASGTHFSFDDAAGAYTFRTEAATANSTLTADLSANDFIVSAGQAITLTFAANTTNVGHFGEFVGFGWEFLADAGSGGGAGVPEPSSFALLGMVGAFGWYRRRRRNTTVG